MTLAKRGAASSIKLKLDTGVLELLEL